jgi:hypothetical protein
MTESPLVVTEYSPVVTEVLFAMTGMLGGGSRTDDFCKVKRSPYKVPPIGDRFA